MFNETTISVPDGEIESEDILIQRALFALSQCAWTVGECAAKWCRKYAKGQTDADFGNMIGQSGDYVYERRRVWETFADVAFSGTYRNLTWSHFRVAVPWDDAAECLQWADEIEATVAEMRAWRRAQRGEDLSEPGDQIEPLTPNYATVDPLDDSEPVDDAENSDTAAPNDSAATVPEPPGTTSGSNDATTGGNAGESVKNEPVLPVVDLSEAWQAIERVVDLARQHNNRDELNKLANKLRRMADMIQQK